MSTTESRAFKINLQIRKSRNHIVSPSNNKAKHQMPTTKSTNHSKKLTVTVHNRQGQKTSLSTFHQAVPKKIVISEFRVTQQDPNWNLFPQSLNLSRQKHAECQNKQNFRIMVPPKPSGRQWWQEAQLKQKLEKKEIIELIIKKEAQISFYQNLLEEKNSQFIQEIWIKQRSYEEYIQGLISIYQSQLEKNKQFSKDLQELQFQKKRQTINLEGKMGLNFSPKQLSTFSGMSGGSILLESIQRYQNRSSEQKKRRSEIFSFGSSNKLERSRSFNKQAQMISFLNPGRSLMQRGKRIAFE